MMIQPLYNKTWTTWQKMWGMQFHPEKCISLSVTKSQTPFQTSYILKGHTLELVTTAKYLLCEVTRHLRSIPDLI
jgi:hypothetical protein